MTESVIMRRNLFVDHGKPNESAIWHYRELQIQQIPGDWQLKRGYAADFFLANSYECSSTRQDVWYNNSPIHLPMLGGDYQDTLGAQWVMVWEGGNGKGYSSRDHRRYLAIRFCTILPIPLDDSAVRG